MNITMYLPSWELGEPTWRVQQLATGPITEVQLGPAPHPFVVFRDLGDFDTMIGVLVGARAAHGEALARHAARPLVPEPDGWAAQCCDLHGRNCEPPSELCCEECTEADHPGHRNYGPCSNPDLSPNRLVPEPVIESHAHLSGSSAIIHRERDPDGMPAGWAQMHEDLAGLSVPDDGLEAPGEFCDNEIPGVLGKRLRCWLPSGHPMPHRNSAGAAWEPANAADLLAEGLVERLTDLPQRDPGDDEAQDAADRALRRAGVDPADLAELRGEDV